MQRPSKEDLAAQQPFMDSILADPDDLSNYQVFSDWLIERGDPRGELIGLELQLNSPNVKGDERKTLSLKVKELEDAHAHLWMPEPLVPYLCSEPEDRDASYSFSFSKGFLASIYFDIVPNDFLEAVANSDLRLLWDMSIGMIDYGKNEAAYETCLLYTSPSPRDQRGSRMPSSA